MDLTSVTNLETNLNKNVISEIFKALFTNRDEGVLVGDNDGKILFVNRAAKLINDDFDFPLYPDDRTFFFSDNEQLSSDDLPLRRSSTPTSVKRR